MELDGLRVSKDNEFVGARLADFRMSVTQGRIIAWMASLVHSTKDADFKVVKTTTNQLSEIARHKYTRWSLEKDLRDLRSATAVIREGSQSIICGIIDSAKVDMTTGEVRLQLGKEMMPYLLKLGETQRGFTSYMLDAFLQIKSANSQRLFELLSQWKNKGSVRFELDELKHKLALGEEVKQGDWVYKYPQWRDFERGVLRQAEEDLWNAGMHVFYLPVRTGRKITHVDFSMMSNAQNMGELKRQYSQLFTYDLTDYERMQIAYTNKPHLVQQAMIETDKLNVGLEKSKYSLSPLRDLKPVSRADFYKKWDRIQKWKGRQEAATCDNTNFNF